MSWLSSALKGAGKAVTGVAHGVGDALSNKYVKGALAAGLAATGVGAPAAAALLAGEGLAGGALKRGGGLKGAVGGGISGGLTGGAAALAGGALGKLGGTAAQALMNRGGAGAADPGGDTYNPDAAGVTLPNTDTGGGGIDWGGLLKSGVGDIGGFLTGNGGKNALGLAGGINSALLQKKSTDLANQAVTQAQEQWKAKAPLRAQGLAGMSGTAAFNPYAIKSPAPTAQPLMGA